MKKFPYVITVSSEKGGVGKTTLATNLAIFLKALDEELPVSIFSFDNHFTIDKMFSFKGTQPEGSVADFLSGKNGDSLLKIGQYGVNYIPSSHNLSKDKNGLRGPMTLARILANSDIGGILIIDTRPDLDTLTENALYAADKVLIPVKDMPSLENCRNIFALFDKRGLDKKSLLLIPCLIDERIKYEGLFSDQKTLLRAFAINRGYKCHDVYVSKSPKVESLNTNPDGKIYPILTHGKGTDVHSQFALLAKSVLDEYWKTGEPRSYLFSKWMAAEGEQERTSFEARLSGLSRECMICNRQLGDGTGATAGYYYETSDSTASGFIDEECFFRLLGESVYRLKGSLDKDDPSLMLLRESSSDSIFVFKPETGENSAAVVDFRRYDSSGQLMTNRIIRFREHAGGMFHDEKCPLYSMMSGTLAGYGGNFRNAFLMVHPVDPESPEKILLKEQYRNFSTIKRKIASLLT